jgi:large subunit ribosomal protein L3
MGRGGSQKQGVYKGKKMHGHWGHELTTVQNLYVVAVYPEQNLILISGAVPGPEGSYVTIHTSAKKPTAKREYNIVTKQALEAIEAKNLELENKEELHEQNEIAQANVDTQVEAVETAKENAEAVAHHEELLAKEEKGEQ